MFLPLRDQIPLRRLKAAHVTRLILLVTTLVWLGTWSGLIAGGVDPAALMGGVIPAVLWGQAALPPGYDLIPAPLTLVTTIVLHAGFVHLVGNMLFLQVFGDNVEDSMGHAAFLGFYIACGAAGALLHAVLDPASEHPLIGASGAVAGVIGAYLVLHPRAQIWGLMLNLIPMRISAAWMLGLWISVQIYHAVSGDEASTAWWAHVGGFATGLALIPWLRRLPSDAVAPPA
jgi:membrane associated rhomboid family serine protease